jgi:hypothetical protein
MLFTKLCSKFGEEANPKLRINIGDSAYDISKLE